jgi:hypothetical protein
MVVPGSNGMFLPIFLSAGRVTGTWKRTTTARKTTIVLNPFEKLKKLDFELLELAIKEYGSYLAHPVELSR